MTENAFGEPASLLVLGGTSDIGLATARRLVARGARRVVLAGRHAEALQEAKQWFGPEALVEVVGFDADQTDRHGPLIERVFVGGDVDVVLLAFGLLGDQADAEEDPEMAVQLARTNYLGAVSVGLHVAGRLRRQGHGVLVVLSSVAGERVRRSNFLYGSTKAGLDAFSQGLGEALRGTGARVMIVRPGFVRSKMTRGMRNRPLATTPEAVAEAIVLGLQRRSEVVWVPSLLRPIMMVLRHLPRPIFRRLPT